MRRLTWCAASHNFTFHAQHVPGKHNDLADMLSRSKLQEFRKGVPDAAAQPCQCPPHCLVMWS